MPKYGMFDDAISTKISHRLKTWSKSHAHKQERMGAQWLSGRVLDSRPKGSGSSLTGVTALWSLSKTHLS